MDDFADLGCFGWVLGGILFELCGAILVLVAMSLFGEVGFALALGIFAVCSGMLAIATIIIRVLRGRDL